MNAPPRKTLHLKNGGGEMHFRLVPGGISRIGAREGNPDEEPVHSVYLAPFWMAETPVTQRQYKAFDPDHKKGVPEKLEHPAENMDWHAANRFCEWLKHGARLPTEAEWEVACRAKTDTDYCTGDGAAALDLAGWYGGNSKGGTHPVRKKIANGYELYDMHGNVWEWCSDTWDPKAYRGRIEGDPDPRISATVENVVRVLRGGSWFRFRRGLPLRLPRLVNQAGSGYWRPRFPGLSAPRSGGAGK